MKIKVLSVAVVALLSSHFAIAADSEGKFAAKGAGRSACTEFNKAFTQKTNEYYAYGGWIEGYVSAFNSYQKDTYDITPWQSTELMMFMLSQHCKANPEKRILTAVNEMLTSFAPGRADAEPDLIEITTGSTKSYFYDSTIAAIRTSLKEKGFEVDSNAEGFDKSLAAALLAFQKEKGIKESGLPDQETLVNLFLMPAK